MVLEDAEQRDDDEAADEDTGVCCGTSQNSEQTEWKPQPAMDASET